MATHKSAIKRSRQSIRRNAVNGQSRSQVRTVEKRIRKAIETKDKKAAEAMLASFTSAVDKAKTKGVIHAKNAARRISRVSQQIFKLS